MLMDRRTFLKSIGVAGASGLIGCDGAPIETLYAYLTPPDNVVPGQAQYYATICRACPSGCGLLVKNREGRPIKLEGNPVHPVNKGKLCARGQAFIQSLYSDRRVKKPMIKKGTQLETVSWQEVWPYAKKALQSQHTFSISGLENGSLSSLFTAISGEHHAYYEPLAPTSWITANKKLFNKAQVPRIDISRADEVICFGADILDSWLSPVEFARQWATGHDIKSGRKLKLTYLGAHRNLTATAADTWHTVPNYDLAPILGQVAARYFTQKQATLSSTTSQFVKTILTKLGTDTSNQHNDLVTWLLSKLQTAKHPLVLFGGMASHGAQATSSYIATMAINIISGAFDKSIWFEDDHAWSQAKSEAHIARLLSQAAQNDDSTLILHNTNIVYDLPNQQQTMKQLHQIGTVISLAYEHNETTQNADIILPIHHPLETWGDYSLCSSVKGMMQPVRQPLYASKHVGNLLLDMQAIKTKQKITDDFKTLIASNWSALLNTKITMDNTFSKQFDDILVHGGFYQSGEKKSHINMTHNPSHIPALHHEKHHGPVLYIDTSSHFYDGRDTAYSWLLETPHSITQTAWEIPILISEDTAKTNGLQNGSVTRITQQHLAITGTVYIDAELPQNTIIVILGGGRKQHEATITSSNGNQILTEAYDRLSGQLIRYTSNVKLTKIGQEKLTITSGSDNSQGRQLALSMTEKDYKAGKFPVMTRHGEKTSEEAKHHHYQIVPLPHQEQGENQPQDNITKLQKHPNHRWGITVDLDKCIGCGACVVACYAENNIPVVGKDEVTRGRELSWIRIEKHTFKQKKIRFLPVMCQHCDNAPCETVCPVFASYHTPDGLNAQIYNRCVGTRYCSNNCPYKVRRFNYFKYTRTEISKQQLNPDVTVRSRGVMEKCTLCIQRIREVTNRAKKEKRPIRDGEITPACAQTCPTGAITFGDFKQTRHTMTKIAKDPRAYRLLDWIVNTRPGVVYLRHVESQEEEA